jgi:hypothetical protein
MSGHRRWLESLLSDGPEQYVREICIMYYEIEVVRWCSSLQRESRMRLTYRRDYVPEVRQWRDFLVSATPI